MSEAAPKPEEAAPPATEGLLDRTKKFAARAVAEWVQRPVAEVGAWLRRRILLFAVGLVLVSVAIVFVFVGGTIGLRELEVPDWATFLGLGVIAGLAGALVLTRK